MLCDFSLKIINLSELEEILLNQSYLCGFTPTNADKILFRNTDLRNNSQLSSKYPNVDRWYNHIKSFSQVELDSFQTLSEKDINIPGISLHKNTAQTSSNQKVTNKVPMTINKKSEGKKKGTCVNFQG